MVKGTSEATQRLLALNAQRMPLSRPSRPGLWIRGWTPTGGHFRHLAEAAGWEVALWDVTPGVLVDSERSEFVIVLGGTAVVRLEGGTEVELRPGSCIELHEHERAEWLVMRPLRALVARAIREGS